MDNPCVKSIRTGRPRSQALCSGPMDTQLCKRLAVLLLLSTILAGSTHARTVRFALLQARPYAWVDDGGKPQGLYADIAAALGSTAKVEVTLDVLPFARAAALVSSGDMDATLMFATEKTLGKARQEAVVFYTDQIVQLRPGLPVAQRKDLAPMTIGRMIGGCQELASDTSVTWKFQDLTSQDSGLRMLAAARIDGFCTVTEAIVDAARRNGLLSVVAQGRSLVLASRPVWLLVSPTLPAESRDRLRAALTHLQTSGEIDAIFRRHLGNAYVVKLPDRTRTPIRP